MTIQIWSGKKLKEVPMYDSALPRPFEDVREVRKYNKRPEYVFAYDRAGRLVGQVLLPTVHELEDHPALYSKGSGLIDVEGDGHYDRFLINMATARIRLAREEKASQ